MSTQTDLIIPYSALKYDGDDRASIALATPEHEVISALLMQTVRRHAETLAQGARVTPVSVTIDVTGIVSDAGTIQFVSKVDRKTRTLFFIGGEAMQGDTPLLKATAIYRIG